MKMALAREMTLTVLLFLVTYVAGVRGSECTTEQGCREYTSCKTGGTVYCCPGGGRLEVNGTSGVCNCIETGIGGLSCSGGASVAKGYQFFPGGQCTTGERCRQRLSCTKGGTVYCCPNGEALEFNGTSSVCNCNATYGGYSCSGSDGIGRGSYFLPADCKSGRSCSREVNSCTVGSTSYCCPGGHVTAWSSGGELKSCSCRYDKTDKSCNTYSSSSVTYSSSSVTSASALTCAMASFMALVFAASMSHK